ncbi:hypothetical protein [Streptomyces celluloflavus]|uniref:hypothetical protein n=1 Tax=Streptomyces celluloflavus TaxID=58344 RepID=UPI003657AD2C
MHEIAARHGRAYDTVRNQWARHPNWPDSTGKRGRYKEYDTTAVDTWVRNHVDRPGTHLQPTQLYTATEIAKAAGISAGTIRADRTRGRWPEPDNTDGGVNRWLGSTATSTLAKRRGYRSAMDQPGQQTTDT